VRPKLETRYLGLDLAHPVVASAGPLSRDLDGLRRLEDGGVSAIVLFSLFEEQLVRETDAIDRLTRVGADSFGEAASFFPSLAPFEVGPDRYLDLVRRARESLSIPVIASLNGASVSGFAEYARLLEQAGASALELNVHFVAADPRLTSADVERRYLDVVSEVKRATKLPVAVKVGPFFSSFAHFARRLDAAGADALVLFNRFIQPDIDIERREIVSSLELSSPRDVRLPLTWIGILFGELRAALAATSGADSHVEVVKYLMAGADVVMTTSALLRHGPRRAGEMVAGLTTFLEAHDYPSVSVLRGSMSLRKVADPTAFERANYVRALGSYATPTPSHASGK
jgi:dihydroorotate dehydrogenase (fumarate)